VYAVGARVPIGEGLIGAVIAGKRPLRVADASTDPRTWRPDIIRAERTRSWLGVPLLEGDEVLGALCVLSGRTGLFTEEHERRLTALAGLATAAVRQARLLSQAQEAIRARDAFFATISHDLKNPVTAIQGRLQLMRSSIERAETPEMQTLVQGLLRAEASTARVTRLINELLDLARLQGGQALELDREAIDLVELVRRAVEEHQRVSDQHRIVVESVSVPLVGEWDRGRLERVMDNLLSNAVRYSPRGGTVTVTVDRDTDPAGPWAIVRVEDRGMGIPAEDVPRVFDRFYRGSNARHISGTGLGLSGARDIVEAHGGAISIASRLGGGTTVTVRLPLLAG
jgi:signal transduction histidine kinase